jgi:hypothetical protein
MKTARPFRKPCGFCPPGEKQPVFSKLSLQKSTKSDIIKKDDPVSFACREIQWIEKRAL